MFKIALFVDGSNAYATARQLEIQLDYKRLLVELSKRGYLLRAYYYSAVRPVIGDPTSADNYSSIRPLLDWLQYNGYTLVSKDTKEFTNEGGIRKIKGNMDIEIAVDAMELASHIDHAFIVSGDGDFTSLVAALQRKGVRVSIISTLRTNPPMIADELRRQADEFIDLMEWQTIHAPRKSPSPTRG
jgi:uncharacterized LabA/DUF88 family protein